MSREEFKPATGTPASPAFGERRGEKVDLHVGMWKDGRWSYLYGAAEEPGEQLAGGLGAFFLLTEAPERYGLPAQAESPVQENVVPATIAAVGAGLLAGLGVAAAFLWEKTR